MIDPDQLDPQARRLWDEMFADGFPGGDGPQVALWSFGHWCMLELGRVPAAVELALDPKTGPMLHAYKEARLAASRAEQRASSDDGDRPDEPSS